MRWSAVQGGSLRAALAMSDCSTGGSNNGSSTITTFMVSLPRRYCFSMPGTGAGVLGAPKHPNIRRLLASLQIQVQVQVQVQVPVPVPVPNPIEQVTRREALRMHRAVH